jgi:hypothetical protein
MDERSACSLGGAFNVTFTPTADSPQECACSQCSYSVAPGHVDDPLSLVMANIEYFLEPLFASDAGTDPFTNCDSNEISTCSYQGSCMYPFGGPISSTFMLTVNDGKASGTQSFVVPGPDGGATVNCTYEVTASPTGG